MGDSEGMRITQWKKERNRQGATLEIEGDREGKWERERERWNINIYIERDSARWMKTE